MDRFDHVWCDDHHTAPGGNVISVVIPSLTDAASCELVEKAVESYKETASREVEFIPSIANAPFAVNVNAGLKKATGDMILVSNNDVIALPGWDEWIQKAVGLRCRILNELSPIASLSPAPQCGWGFAFSRQTLEKVGLLDEDLVNSYDDYDWFIRAAQHGITRALPNKCYAIHQGGATLNKIWGEFREATSKRMAQCKANRAVMLRKWPGLNIDAVPSLYWVTYGPQIMQEWSKQNVQAF